jgi:DNA helicase-2/ATP-dependent DNA helicase PcrA
MSLQPATAQPPASQPVDLNAAQREAVQHGIGAEGIARDAPPLLIIAGAGTGKTHTLAHRVARLILAGADPQRILLLTFSRRAAAEMVRRAQRICAQARPDAGPLRWSGTFHAVANRLLRQHAEAVGLDSAFTVLDRSDAADQLDLVREELGLARRASRFPRKSTCHAIYSHVVNARCELEQALQLAFPWCSAWAAELRQLFAGYVAAKQRHGTLDYDDLLLYWYHLMQEPALAEQVRARFDFTLVDEYQDTNALQAGILLGLAPRGHGLTVVGDDAQAIYGFRAATVRNILDFPRLFDPPARVIALDQNYRSTEPILAAANAVIGLAREGYAKRLRSRRSSQQRPVLVGVADESEQVRFVVERVLAQREAGVDLRRQAVLMRAAHHSDALEVELGRRNIPFVKYGGLKFLEAAHVKDLLCVLRWAENPRDAPAAFRVLQLLPGVGPTTARRALAQLEQARFGPGALERFGPPAAAAHDWPALCALLARLRDPRCDWRAQVGAVRDWYRPHLERLHDAAAVRAGDLEQLEQIAAGYPTREAFLSDLALDPPAASGDLAGPPRLDEDYLILSTIHSAKGQEWDAVYLLSCADGCIPSDMATSTPEQLEEERRLLYVAMTRARDHLYLIHPLRFFVRHQPRHGDAHVFSPRSRFLPDAILAHFERYTPAQALPAAAPGRGAGAGPRIDVGARLRAMWQ